MHGVMIWSLRRPSRLPADKGPQATKLARGPAGPRVPMGPFGPLGPCGPLGPERDCRAIERKWLKPERERFRAPKASEACEAHQDSEAHDQSIVCIYTQLLFIQKGSYILHWHIVVRTGANTDLSFFPFPFLARLASSFLFWLSWFSLFFSNTEKPYMLLWFQRTVHVISWRLHSKKIHAMYLPVQLHCMLFWFKWHNSCCVCFLVRLQMKCACCVFLMPKGHPEGWGRLLLYMYRSAHKTKNRENIYICY